jgi:hypothetical protein
LIAKCTYVGRDFFVLIFLRAEDFESWREGRKGLSKSGEKCSRRKVHMYAYANCYNEFSLQSYLDLNLSKSIVKVAHA